MNSVQHYKTFCDSVSETGVLSWWVATDDGTFQVEFTGAQLYNRPDRPGSPPSSTMALRFSYGVSASFLTRPMPLDRGPNSRELPSDWPLKLHTDKLETPLRVSSGELWLADDLDFAPHLEGCHIHTHLGSYPSGVELLGRPHRLVVWAGAAGLAVASRNLVLLNHDGEIPWEDVPHLKQKWWSYWAQYWQRKSTSEPLPFDYACEVTVPE